MSLQAIRQWTASHVGCSIKFEQSTNGSDWIRVAGKIAVDANGVTCIRNEAGELYFFPEENTMYRDVRVVSEGRASRGTDEREGSTSPTNITDVFEQYRVAMTNETQRQAQHASAERELLRSNQDRMMQLLTAIEGRLSAMERVPASPSPQRLTVGSLAGPSNDNELVELLAQREAEAAKVISSWRLPRTDGYTGEMQQALKNLFPEYKFLRSDPHAQQLRRAICHMAVAAQDVKNRGISHMQYAEEIARNAKSARCSFTPLQAAEIQTMLSLAQTSAGTLDWILVCLTELSCISMTDLGRTGTNIVERLRLARVGHPETTNGVVDCPTIPFLPVRTLNSQKSNNPRKTSNPRKCNRCGDDVTVSWETHNKTCKKQDFR